MLRTILATSRRVVNAPTLRVSSAAPTFNHTRHFRQFHLSRSNWSEDPKKEPTEEEKPQAEAEEKAEEKVEVKTETTEKQKFDEMLAKKNKEISQILKREKEQKAKDMEELKNRYMKKFDELLETKEKEMQNLRTRTSNDVEAAKKYSAMPFAKSMLEVADNLTMALGASREDAHKGDNPKLLAFFEGIEMTEKLLLKSFEANHVVQMDPVGAKFDPNFHEGLFEYPDPALEAGHVGQVVNHGYMFKDRVLRAAKVGTIRK